MIMELIVDTNIIVAAILKRGLTRNLLFNSNLYLYAPENLYFEITKHEREFMQRMGIKKKEFEDVLLVLGNSLEILPLVSFEGRKKDALNLAPDRDDWPYFAVAMLKGCPVWSNDKRLKQQKKVKVLSTEELYKLLSRKEWLI